MSSDTFFDWYFWPLLAEDGVDFVEHPDGYDYYHCSGRKAPGRQYEGCQYYKTGDGTGARDVCPSCNPSRDLRAAGDGALRVGVSTWASAGPITVSYEATLYRNLAAVAADDLAAIKELWLTTCWPWAAPEGWDWPRYQLEDREAVRGERDPRRKPHCDWWRGMTPEAVDAVADCRDVDGVACDAGGRGRNRVPFLLGFFRRDARVAMDTRGKNFPAAPREAVDFGAGGRARVDDRARDAGPPGRAARGRRRLTRPRPRRFRK